MQIVPSATTEPTDCISTAVDKTINAITNKTFSFIFNQNSVVHVLEYKLVSARSQISVNLSACMLSKKAQR